MENKFFYSHKFLMIVQILIFYNKVTCHPQRASPTNSNTLGYIKTSCATTLYPNFCYQSLSRYEGTVKSNPRTLVLTAISVTFNSTSSALKLLKNMERSHPGSKPGELASLLECVEVVGDSVYELHRSLSRLSRTERGYNFVAQMNDVQTWVSAALTDDDTCIDDFNVNGKMKIVVRGLILRIARLASVALAFINSYAGV